MKRLLLILNPCSGKKRANRALAEIVSIFNRGGYDVTVYTTAARGDATQVAASRCREFDCVVCAGGDGTFNEVVSGVYAAGSDTPIGYIPAGSTNDFASSMHLSRNCCRPRATSSRASRAHWTSAASTAAASPMSPRSARSPAHPTPRRRA